MEIKVAKFADKLEASGKENPSSIKEKVQQYRHQLLEVWLHVCYNKFVEITGLSIIS